VLGETIRSEVTEMRALIVVESWFGNTLAVANRETTAPFI